MRDFEFRGKRVDNGEWVFGSLIVDKTYMEDVPYIVEHGSVVPFAFNSPVAEVRNIYRVKPETVGMYIGQTDRNDKKIFMGDIARVHDQHDGWYAKRVVGDVCGFDLLSFSKWDIKVIGNIFDNPELMKEDEE